MEIASVKNSFRDDTDKDDEVVGSGSVVDDADAEGFEDVSDEAVDGGGGGGGTGSEVEEAPGEVGGGGGGVGTDASAPWCQKCVLCTFSLHLQWLILY